MIDQPGIQRFWNNVLPSEMEVLHLVCLVHHFGNIFLGQLGQGIHRGDLHLFVDPGGAHIQGPPENKRKAEHIVDLIGIIRTPGGKNDILPRLHGFLIGNFGIGIGHGKNDGIPVHRFQHLRGEHIRHRQSQEHISTRHDLFQR